MSVFYENIHSKGWDKYFLSVEKEFEVIREELSLSHKKDNILEIEVLNTRANVKNDVYSVNNISSPKDITKEFTKLREELNISSFSP